MNRREFLTTSAGAILWAKEVFASAVKQERIRVSRIALVKTRDRKHGVKKAVELLGINPLKSKNVLIKPNFNSADPPPASTHDRVLEALMEVARDMGARSLAIGERSGFAGLITTESVLKKKRIYPLAQRYNAKIINFDNLEENDWIKINPPSGHWINGFKIARPVVEAEALIWTPCLKTHRFGGVFTMSLKLAVGAVKKSYMPELHASVFSMRKMIAEINTAFTPHIIVMDGVDVFTDGGPEKGELKHGDIILAGTDRVAIDAAGLAVLKFLGSNRHIMNTPVFQQDQIKRAVELGLGVSSPAQIEFITADEESRKYAEKLQVILKRG